VIHLVPALFGADDGIFGGGERYAFELARHMAAEVPTSLLTFGDRDRRETIDGLEVRVIGRPWHVRGQRTNPFSHRMFAELRDADVVHCYQQHVLVSSVAALFCRMSGRRVFTTDLGGGGWDISAYLSTDRWYHGHLHLSEYSLRLFGHDRNGSAHVVLGGVDTEKFSPSESVARGDMVLYAGRVLPHKGVDNLVKAMPPDMELQIIGHQFDQRFITDLHRLGAAKRVTFRHDCDDEALVAAYRRAACVVLPSVYRTMYGQETPVPELLGQTLLEAMACEAPTICTNVASMPEIVKDGITGFVVPPNDPAALGQRILWLREHPAEATTMGRLGRQCVLERFTWPQVVQRCLAIYRS
jgi:glycosyltransferase involved in cell wall biosynthesis